VTDLMAGEIIAIIMLALAVAYLISRLVRETPDIVDCGMVADVDEDIQQPRVEVIDDALRQVGADNRGAQDWLLDRRLAEMQRRAAS